MSTRDQTTRATSSVGARVELASYSINGQDRTIYGQRVDGVVRVSDHPTNGQGRRYLVERELELDGYGALKALVADYVTQAAKHLTIPAADNPVDRYLQGIA